MEWPGLLIKHGGIKHILYIWPCLLLRVLQMAPVISPHCSHPTPGPGYLALDTSQLRAPVLIKQGENNS